MPFNSLIFLLFFLPIAVGGARFFALRGEIARFQWWLVGASLLFYAYGAVSFLWLLVASILVNLVLVRLLVDPTRTHKDWILWIGLLINLGALAFFKYSDFLLGIFGATSHSGNGGAFPLGLSFFVIQQIMLLVDAYEGLVPSYSVREAFTFVSLFPYVTMGPISRARQIIPQLAAPRIEKGIDWEAVSLIAVGLSKKVLLADNLGLLVSNSFSAGPNWGAIDAWIAAAGFGLQLYFDFSGYSDIAVGAARLFGVSLPRNFNAPFRAKNVADFWQRWHITLTSFINTYLFTPIVRRLGKVTLRTSAVATMVAMLIAGLWHGPSWTYVVFGGLHGAALCVNQVVKKRKIRIQSVLAHLATLSFLAFGFLVFRAPSLDFAFSGALAMLGRNGFSSIGIGSPQLPAGYAALVLIAAVVSAGWGPTSDELAKAIAASPARAITVGAIAAASMAVMISLGQSQFVYNQF